MPKGIYKKPGYNGTPTERFWKYVKKTNTCWLWIGTKTTAGYGALRLRGESKQQAHRFSYELHKGTIPNGMCVLHSCDNPPCVNPSHLWLGTLKDNAIDREKKGRGVDNKGEKNSRAKLTLNQVEKIRELYETAKYFQRELGVLFSVSRSNIREIVNKNSWKK